MADDPNNPTPNFVDPGNQAQFSAQQITQFNAVIQESSNGFNIYNQSANLASNALSMFNDKISKAKNFLSNPNMTTQEANAFNILSTAVTGASKSFDALNDNTGLTNFSNQIKYTIATILDGGKNVGGAITGLVKAAKDLGIADSAISSLMQKAKAPADIVNGLSGLLKNLGDAADSALKFQNSYFGLMSTTGQANQIFDQAGSKLENLNNLLEDQSRMITSAHGATGVALPVISKYYEALGKIPGVLQMQVASGGDASKSVSMLQETIQLAHGSGRDFEAVVKDLTVAWELYGRTGEKAELFTARMSELANNFGIRIQDTEGFLNRMAESFKLLGDNSEGTAHIFNQFFGELQRGGLGVKPAVEIIEQMTGAIGKMSIAQRAFLSSRSGGPGGLLGAIEIEKDLRAGNVDKVFDNMRRSLMQQFGGRIVTQDQVSTQQDASQFQRQRMLLQSGAFGNIAANDEQATRILEAIANPGRKELQGAKDLLRQQVDRGSAIEQKSFTQLIEINKRLEEIKMQGGFRTLNLAQSAFTGAGTGALNQSLKSNVAESSQQGAMATTGNQGQDASNQYANDSLRGLIKSTKDLTISADSAKRAASETFTGPRSIRDAKMEQRKQYEAERQRVAAGTALPRNTDPRANIFKDSLNESLAQPRNRSLPVIQATNAAVQSTAPKPTSTETTPESVPITVKPNEKLDLTVNVYVGDKKHVSQQQVQLDGGVRTNVNGM